MFFTFIYADVLLFTFIAVLNMLRMCKISHFLHCIICSRCANFHILFGSAKFKYAADMLIFSFFFAVGNLQLKCCFHFFLAALNVYTCSISANIYNFAFFSVLNTQQKLLLSQLFTVLNMQQKGPIFTYVCSAKCAVDVQGVNAWPCLRRLAPVLHAMERNEYIN